MYIVGLFLAVAMALLGIGGVELGLAYSHGQSKLYASHLAQDYTDQAEQGYLQTIATAVQAGTLPANGGITVDSGTPVPICGAGVTSCNTYAKYTVTPAGGSSVTANAGEQSQNINTAVSENRAAATIAVTLSDANGSVIAHRTRTITIRTLPESPYASIVSSSDSLEPYTIGSGVVGGVNAATEGDVAGCNGDTTTCGQNTEVNSYATCNNLAISTTGMNPTQLAQYQMYKAYCNDKTNYVPSGASSSNYAPAPTSTYGQSTWQNADANASGN
jgi:hypothetical protein